MFCCRSADKVFGGSEALVFSCAIRRAAWLLGMTAPFVWSQTDLGEASLEELLNTKITSVSKKEQKLSQAAAAIFVINQDDIRRSGANSIPDLLRLVPGV